MSMQTLPVATAVAGEPDDGRRRLLLVEDDARLATMLISLFSGEATT